jgi:hypothetical protein
MLAATALLLSLLNLLFVIATFFILRGGIVTLRKDVDAKLQDIKTKVGRAIQDINQSHKSTYDVDMSQHVAIGNTRP